MRRFLLYAAYGLIAVTLQGSCLSHFPSPRLNIDLIFLAVVFLGFTTESQRGIPIVVLFGGLIDASSAGPFGISIFSFSVAYLFLRALISQIAFQAGFAQFFWIAAASAVEKIACALLVIVWTGKAALAWPWLARILPQAMSDGIVGLAMIPFLGWYERLSWEGLRAKRDETVSLGRRSLPDDTRRRHGISD